MTNEVKYILNISEDLNLNLKHLVIQDLKQYLAERNFSLDTVPCYGLKQALNEILPVYGCERYFSLTSAYIDNSIRDGAMEWYVQEFKRLAKRLNPEEREKDA